MTTASEPLPNTGAENEPANISEMEVEYARLEAALAEHGPQAPDPSPKALPLSHINCIPEVFQPRGMYGTDHRHVKTLRNALKNGGKLAPVLIFWVAGEAYLLDGHHRLEAYRLERKTASVPVTTFAGTLAQALVRSTRANSLDKLPMSHSQKMDRAWMLVRLGKLSKSAIADATTASVRTVARMRNTLKQLGAEASEYTHWWQADAAAKGHKYDMSEEHVDQLAEEFAQRMTKAFGSKLTKTPDLAALVFEKHFGRRFEDVLRSMKRLSSDFNDDEEEVEDDDPDADF